MLVCIYEKKKDTILYIYIIYIPNFWKKGQMILEDGSSIGTRGPYLYIYIYILQWSRLVKRATPHAERKSFSLNLYDIIIYTQMSILLLKI